MKKIVSLFLLFLLIAYFLFCPQRAFYATQEGILLWFGQILPTLLPFSVFSYIFMESNTLEAVGRRLPIRIPLYDIYILFCGFLFGFPIGSKLSADFCRKGLISENKAQILCAYTNNLSPVFISSYVLSQTLQQPERIWITYGIVYLVPFVLCAVHLERLKEPVVIHKNTASRFHLNMQIIDAGIINGFEILIKLCGYIVLFRIIIEMLKLFPLHTPLAASLLFGITEVTNGIAYLSQASLSGGMKYALAVGILSFGGACGIAQTGSMIADTGLSLKKYVATKAVLTAVCSALSALFLMLS